MTASKDGADMAVAADAATPAGTAAPGAPTVPDAAPSPLTVAIGLAVAIAAISSAATLFKLSEAPALVKAFYRLLYATVILAPFAVVRHRADFAALGRRDILALSGVGVILALHFATWIASLDLTSVTASLVLVTIHPVLVAGFAQVFMREHLPTRKWVGILVAVLGAVGIALADRTTGGHALLGDLLAFAGAICFAAYLLGARSYRQRMPLLPFVTVVYAAATVTLLVLSLLWSAPLSGWDAQEHGLFLALAVVPMIFGHTVINWVVRYVPAAVVSTTILLEPLGGTLIAYLALGELASPVVLAGGGVVLLGVWLVAR